MKKNLLLLLFAAIVATVQAQDSIPNGNFERWDFKSYEFPQNYPYNSNVNAGYNALPLGLTRTSDAAHGQWAVQLTTVGQPGESQIAYLLNTDPHEGDISSWTNGMPYTQTPTGIRGYYKYNVASGDSALLMIVFRKNLQNIGTYQYKLGGLKETYTLIDYSFEPALNQAPDSVVLAVVSSNFMVNENGVPGSTIKIDDLSFTGVASQPELMNGDFEVWEAGETQKTPLEWHSYEQGLSRSTDAMDGNYALKLQTYAGENNGLPSARPGYLTNTYYDNRCDCMRGGIPFNVQKDTLTFWYKYIPVNGDTGQISINFLKNGSNIFGDQRELTASTNYKYMEIPFEMYTEPDTLQIWIQSSKWENSDLSYVGSVLTLDNLKLKSKLTAGLQAPTIQNGYSIVPSNATGKYRIISPDNNTFSYDICSMTGSRIEQPTTYSNEINLSSYPAGIYLIRIFSNNALIVKRIIK